MPLSKEMDALKTEADGLKQEVLKLNTELSGLTEQSEIDQKTKAIDQKIAEYEAVEQKIVRQSKIDAMQSDEGITPALNQLATDLNQVAPVSKDEGTATLLAAKAAQGIAMLHSPRITSQNGFGQDYIYQTSPAFGGDVRQSISQIMSKQDIRLLQAADAHMNILRLEQGLDQQKFGQSLPDDIQQTTTSAGGTGAGKAGITVPTLVAAELRVILEYYNSVRRIANIIPLFSFNDFILAQNVAVGANNAAGKGDAEAVAEGATNTNSTEDLMYTAAKLVRQRLTVPPTLVSVDILNLTAAGAAAFNDAVLQTKGQQLGILEEELMTTNAQNQNIKGFTTVPAAGKVNKAMPGKTLNSTVGTLNIINSVLDIPYRRGAVALMHDDIAVGYTGLTVGGTSDIRFPGQFAPVQDSGDGVEYQTILGRRIIPNNHLVGLVTATSDLKASTAHIHVLGPQAYAIGQYQGAAPGFETAIFDELTHFNSGVIALAARFWTSGVPDHPKQIGTWTTAS